MPGHHLNILQVSPKLIGGGAERIALTLFYGLRSRGVGSYIAVGIRNGDEPNAIVIPENPSTASWGKSIGAIHRALHPLRDRLRGVKSIQRVLTSIQNPRRTIDWYRGREHFHYPGTAAIHSLPSRPPNIIHCHNLHGNYFDLRELSGLSQRFPIAMTLHDEWTFTGHCAYTMGCERWRKGCGACPGLDIYPALARDATAYNWRVKQEIYRNSRLYISTPSKWLMDRVRDSILSFGCAGTRVIYNGVDRAIFRPSSRLSARRKLNLSEEPRMLLFTANAARRNMFKDYETVSRAARAAAKLCPGKKLLLIALGDDGPIQQFDNVELRFVPYLSDNSLVATYYQAADIYLHAAKADNLPTTILEALATGTPVIATAVGGIPEQVRSLRGAPGSRIGSNDAHSLDLATGVLIAPGDADGMGEAAAHLLADDYLRYRLSHNAAQDAECRFDLEKQVDNTLAWYRDILKDWHSKSTLDNSLASCSVGADALL